MRCDRRKIGELTNEWLEKQEVPNLRAKWITPHYGDRRHHCLTEPSGAERHAGWCGTCDRLS
jgi:hypothetical protein